MMRRSLHQMPESEFSFTLVRVAVTQVCQSMGFKSAQNSALEILTDLAIRYMKEIAKLAAASANSEGRTESNLPDIIVALEDLSSVRGFPGSWSIRSIRCLYTSAVMKDLMKFVKYTDEVPFGRPLPPRRRSYSKGKFLKCFKYCDVDRWKHVPRWLPDVPVVVGEEKEVETKKEVRWEDDGWEEARVNENHEKKERLSNEETEISTSSVKVRFRIGVAIEKPGLVGSNLRIGKRVCC